MNSRFDSARKTLVDLAAKLKAEKKPHTASVIEDAIKILSNEHNRELAAKEREKEKTPIL